MKELGRNLGAYLGLAGLALSLRCSHDVRLTRKWGINHLYLITTVIVSLVFVAVAVPFVYAIWRFRDRPEDTHMPKQVRGNHKLEIMWTVIPAILLIFIFVPTFELIHKQYAAPPANALRIKAYGNQFWWEFHYPDLGIVTANELYVPENTPVVIELIKDVITRFGSLAGVARPITFRVKSI